MWADSIRMEASSSGHMAQRTAEEMAGSQVEAQQVSCSCERQQCNLGVVGRLPKSEGLSKKRGQI